MQCNRLTDKNPSRMSHAKLSPNLGSGKVLNPLLSLTNTQHTVQKDLSFEITELIMGVILDRRLEGHLEPLELCVAQCFVTGIFL